jgi:hypothetical protein
MPHKDYLRLYLIILWLLSATPATIAILFYTGAGMIFVLALTFATVALGVIALIMVVEACVFVGTYIADRSAALWRWLAQARSFSRSAPSLG